MSYFADKVSPRRLLQLLAGATFCYWLALTVLMHMPIPRRLQEPDVVLPKDKTVHFVLYAGLATALFVTLEQRARVRPASAPRTRLGRAGVLFVVCAVHGYVEELTQPLSNRTYDLADIFADCIGAGGAIAFCLVLSRMLQSRSA